MQPLLCIANWKAQLSPDAETALARDINANVQRNPAKNVEVVLSPSFVSLHEIGYTIDHPLVLCAQDCYWQESGAATGAVTPVALAHMGCKYVIIGHSERRNSFGETNEMIAKKFAVLLHTQKKLGLVPVVCIGETASEKAHGRTRAVVTSQLAALFASPPPRQSLFVIAYEPVWAISTNETGSVVRCDPSECKKTIAMIRDIIHSSVQYTAHDIAIIYGGSVDAHSASSYVTNGDAAGVLVGGASLHAKSFCAIVQSLNTSV